METIKQSKFSPKFGLKHKLILASISIIFGIVAILSAYFISIQRKLLRTELYNRATSLTKNFSYNCEYPVLLEDLQSLELLTAGIMKEEGIALVQIQASGGKVLIDRTNRLSAEKMEQEFCSSAWETTGLSLFEKNNLLLASFPLWKPSDLELHVMENPSTGRSDSPIGRAIIGFSMEKTRELLISSIRSTIIISLVIGLTVVFISLIIVRNFIRPLSALARGTREISSGNLSYRVKILGNDELGYLAFSFNEMASELENNRKEIEEYSHNLEQKVLKRTEELLISEGEYKRLYQESKRAEEVYRSLIHSSADAIIIYDMKEQLRYISPAFTQIFGWTFEELKGIRIPFVPESEEKASSIIINEVLEKGTPCHGFETKRLTKYGRLLDISISASRFNDYEGKPEGMLVVLRDISERKALENQLLHAHKMEAVGTLAGGIAHDFNNILQAISGYTQILLMEAKLSDSDHAKLHGIEEATQRAGDLVQRLQIFSHKMVHDLRPININHEILQVSKLLERTIPRMISIKHYLTEDIGLINGDSVQIGQVIMNLGINARDSMPDGGELIFETRNVYLDGLYSRMHPEVSPGDYVMLCVRDTGYGISDEIQGHIFEPFFTTKEVGKGTGLGLAMVYAILRGHDGHIYCYSEPGQGTFFKLYFPLLKRGIPEPVKKIRDERIIAGNEIILLVDDEEAILNIGTDILQLYGYGVITAENGEKALELYKREHPQLVILDVNMPGIGGHQCLKELLEIDPHVKVIIASGYSTNDLIREAIRSGAAGFIGKPYQIRDMLAKVREILDKEA
ncbi:MAG: response regulator [Deltaproteobacteria bacterium]|nr:response regulator [Deltaproteobacteria bacterium]